MTTIDFGHTFISGDTAATVTVSGVTEITALDMSSLTKVKTVNVVNNTKLASIIAPNAQPWLSQCSNFCYVKWKCFNW